MLLLIPGCLTLQTLRHLLMPRLPVTIPRPEIWGVLTSVAATAPTSRPQVETRRRGRQWVLLASMVPQEGRRPSVGAAASASAVPAVAPHPGLVWVGAGVTGEAEKAGGRRRQSFPSPPACSPPSGFQLRGVWSRGHPDKKGQAALSLSRPLNPGFLPQSAGVMGSGLSEAAPGIASGFYNCI